MRFTGLLLALSLLPATANAAEDAQRRLLQELCASGGVEAMLERVEAYAGEENLPPADIAEALGAADALSERGYCRAAGAAEAAPQAAFAAFKAASGQGHELDVAFARGRLFAKPPRRGAGPAGARFDGSFLVLGGPGLSLVPQ